MKWLDIMKEVADSVRGRHMRRLLEEHEQMVQSNWAQRLELFGEGPATEERRAEEKRRMGEVVG